MLPTESLVDSLWQSVSKITVGSPMAAGARGGNKEEVRERKGGGSQGEGSARLGRGETTAGPATMTSRA